MIVVFATFIPPPDEQEPYQRPTQMRHVGDIRLRTADAEEDFQAYEYHCHPFGRQGDRRENEGEFRLGENHCESDDYSIHPSCR